jgi:hypothetical protein
MGWNEIVVMVMEGACRGHAVLVESASRGVGAGAAGRGRIIGQAPRLRNQEQMEGLFVSYTAVKSRPSSLLLAIRSAAANSALFWGVRQLKLWKFCFLLQFSSLAIFLDPAREL